VKRTCTAVSLAVLTTCGTAAPAAAGGIGDFLSPAFGVSCANLNNGARAAGATTHGTGAADGNLAGLPVGSALNQCGGADVPGGALPVGALVVGGLPEGLRLPDKSLLATPL
jgi:hypothetical protein